MDNIVKAPGKLYIAGEYSVLSEGQPAILVAVDKYLRCKFEGISKEKIIVNSAEVSSSPYERSFSKETALGTVNADSPWAYVASGIEVGLNYVKQAGITPIGLELTIESDLATESGTKYGLGSSGAVVVCILKAILKANNVSYNSELIYKLAVMAHMLLGDLGSFGDLASICYGGLIYYVAPDKNWLTKELADGVLIYELVNKKWPLLELSPFEMADNLVFTAGWTKEPASTKRLVAHLLDQQPETDGFYKDFLKQAKEVVDLLKDALIEGDFPEVSQQIERYRALLSGIEGRYNLTILTDQLGSLIDFAGLGGWAAKSSGAGGGDCGLAIGPVEVADKAALHRIWKMADILPLDINIAERED